MTDSFDRAALITNSIGVKMVRIPAGTFMMGSQEEEEGRSYNETLYQVVLSQDFYLGVFPITHTEYFQVMGAKPYMFRNSIGDRENNDNHPVEASWDDAVEFCKRLSVLPGEKEAGRSYRLPTEAEWEYACRAGTTTAFCFGDSESDLAKYAWYNENSGGATRPIGEKLPYSWGLCEMHGNVWEWCSDYLEEHANSAVTDTVGLAKTSERVLRGGCCRSEATSCRSASRCGDLSFYQRYNGFRVALSVSTH